MFLIFCSLFAHHQDAAAAGPSTSGLAAAKTHRPGTRSLVLWLVDHKVEDVTFEKSGGHAVGWR